MNKEYSVEIGGKTAKFLNVHIVNMVDTGMIYLSFKFIKNKEIKECSIFYSYTCDDISCNFDKC